MSTTELARLLSTQDLCPTWRRGGEFGSTGRIEERRREEYDHTVASGMTTGGGAVA